MEGGEYRAGTRRRKVRVETIGGNQLGGKRVVLRGPETAGQMARVCTEQGKGRGCGAYQAAHVAGGMAGDVEKVKTAVAEEVVGTEAADLEVVGEVDFFQLVAPRMSCVSEMYLWALGKGCIYIYITHNPILEVEILDS